MHVKVESTGGFAGIERTVAEYDTFHLPADQARAVRDAVASIAAADAPGEVGADMMAYRVTVDGDHVQTVPGDPGDLAKPLATLLNPG